MVACFFSNISAKYYKNPSMISRVIAKNVGDVFFETQCTTVLATIFRCIRSSAPIRVYTRHAAFYKSLSIGGVRSSSSSSSYLVDYDNDSGGTGCVGSDESVY